MNTIINSAEFKAAVAAGYVRQPNGTYAHHDHLKAAAARRAAREEVAKQVNGTFILEKGDVSVTFRVDGDKVLVIRQNTGERYGRRVTMTRALARVEYRHLLNQGFKAW